MAIKKETIKLIILYTGSALVGLLYPFNVFNPFDIVQFFGLILSGLVWTVGFQHFWDHRIWFKESFLNLFRKK